MREAWTRPGGEGRSSELTDIYQTIQKWNRRAERTSEGALAFYAFKKGLGENLASKVEPPALLSDAQLFDALKIAISWLKENFNSLRVPFGTYFRVGRESGDRTWPVSGGSLTDAGMATTRAIGFAPRGKEMVGQKGQTSTQVVILSSPPESYSVIPLGVSDHKESGHWDDQAEKLFSQSKTVPTYFLRLTELLKHTTSTNVF